MVFAVFISKKHGEQNLKIVANHFELSNECKVCVKTLLYIIISMDWSTTALFALPIFQNTLIMPHTESCH